MRSNISRCGIYLGHNPTHAGSVAMVLNSATLHVSPQYHVIFDDIFSTVSSMANGEIPDNWLDLVKLSEEHMDEAGNNLTNFWASEEFNPFHNEEDMETPSATVLESTPQESTITPVNELLMSTMPDMDELTCRRSTRDRKPVKSLIFLPPLRYMEIKSNYPTLHQLCFQ